MDGKGERLKWNIEVLADVISSLMVAHPLKESGSYPAVSRLQRYERQKWRAADNSPHANSRARNPSRTCPVLYVGYLQDQSDKGKEFRVSRVSRVS